MSETDTQQGKSPSIVGDASTNLGSDDGTAVDAVSSGSCEKSESNLGFFNRFTHPYTAQTGVQPSLEADDQSKLEASKMCQPSKKRRPCKTKRDRYRRLVESLVAEAEKDPQQFLTNLHHMQIPHWSTASEQNFEALFAAVRKHAKVPLPMIDLENYRQRCLGDCTSTNQALGVHR